MCLQEQEDRQKSKLLKAAAAAPKQGTEATSACGPQPSRTAGCPPGSASDEQPALSTLASSTEPQAQEQLNGELPMAQESPCTAAAGSPISGTAPSGSGVTPARRNQANGGSHPAQPREDCSMPMQWTPTASSSAQPESAVDKQLLVDRPEQVPQVEGGSSQTGQGAEAPSASHTTSPGQGAGRGEGHQQNGSAASRKLGLKQAGKTDMPPSGKGSSIRVLPNGSRPEKEPVSNGNSVQSGTAPNKSGLPTAKVIAGSIKALGSA